LKRSAFHWKIFRSKLCHQDRETPSDSWFEANLQLIASPPGSLPVPVDVLIT
jgi:hypothetical protein